MTYPSQPGYPAPQYGGQPPQQPQQNNLWLIGGAVLTVLIVIMTVILLVVQGTQNDSNSGDGGEDPTGGTNETGDDGGNDGGDNGGDDGGGSGAVELNSDACDAFDFGSFEDAYGALAEEETSRSESSYNGLASINCTFYNEDATSVHLSVSDYETSEDAKFWIDGDADYYNEENGYELTEYTEHGDAGNFFTQAGDGWTSIYIHVAFGSLEVEVNTTLYDYESIDEAAATAVLEDLLVQCGEKFADYA
ncbi:hypothetical protein AB0K52_22215 [Glycomyces sp. NPDC049804]|uniref:hypothetical protein n=1 Tax=Glycomyces sp. NPDC049804 TaxID=3154363 RepID=UPI00342D5BB8